MHQCQRHLASAMTPAIHWCHAEALTKVAADHPGVTIGSYPKTEESQKYGVLLTLQSRDQAALEAASKAVQESIEVFEPALEERS